VQAPEAQKTWSTVYLPEGVTLKTTPPLRKMPPDEPPFGRRSVEVATCSEEQRTVRIPAISLIERPND
jgi:hypothetical protein